MRLAISAPAAPGPRARAGRANGRGAAHRHDKAQAPQGHRGPGGPELDRDVDLAGSSVRTASREMSPPASLPGRTTPDRLCCDAAALTRGDRAAPTNSAATGCAAPWLSPMLSPAPSPGPSAAAAGTTVGGWGAVADPLCSRISMLTAPNSPICPVMGVAWLPLKPREALLRLGHRPGEQQCHRSLWRGGDPGGRSGRVASPSKGHLRDPRRRP